jgi:formylglycine-generating enzyme required for sulfatase activity
MQLGPYTIVEEIGRGGAGSVLRARAPDGADVAVKVLIRATPEILARFERERRLLSEVGLGQGFVPLVDAGQSPSGPYLVMPFMAGGSLRAKLRGPLPIDESIELVRELAETAGHAHARGIVHRDLKPENVLFDAQSRPFIADLGLAKHFAGDTPGASQSVVLSRTGEMRGTIGYMAPEQIASARDVGPAADVFALGAILYECVTGSPAFEGETVLEVLARVSSGSFESPSRRRPGVPRWLVGLISRALAVDPARRFADGAALARALAEKGQRARWWAMLAVGAAVVAAAAVTVVLAPRGPNATPEKASAPVAQSTVSTAPVPKKEEPPAWWRALSQDERPALPLPRGIAFGPRAGEYVNERDGSVLVHVPAGSFRMGRDGGFADQKPAHRVVLSGYFIGKHEVTNAQFGAFVEATSYRTTAEKEGNGIIRNADGMGETAGVTWRRPDPSRPPPPPDHPVVMVSWPDARAYCAWAGLRLPTEAEWERAAIWDPKSGRRSVFAWGDEKPSRGAPPANLADESYRKARPGATEFFDGYDDGFAFTAPVGSFPRGASPCGALDMTGNVAEWCEDVYEAEFYASSVDATDPVVRSKDAVTFDLPRVIRGGSFASRGLHATGTYRNRAMPMQRIDDTGLRVVRDGRDR